MHAVVVASGGMDSTVALALHVAAGHRVTALTIDYGQRHAREVQAAAEIADHYAVEQFVVRVPALHLALGGSALTDASVPVPEGHYEAPSMAATVVPNRNAILANIAVGYAQSLRADCVTLGVHAGDHAVYPDCRPEFIDALNALVRVATDGYHTPRVYAPFVHLSKTSICALGYSLGVPLHLTWSCYVGGAVHCGRCGTCVERREAFDQATVADTTEYAA